MSNQTLSPYGQLKQADVARIINVFVDGLSGKWKEDEILIVNLRMTVSDKNYDNVDSERFSIVYWRPGRYCLVADIDQTQNRFGSMTGIQHSYHDSCWRSDGTERIINEHADALVKRNEKNPKSVRYNTDFDLVGVSLLSDYEVKPANYDVSREVKFNKIKK